MTVGGEIIIQTLRRINEPITLRSLVREVSKRTKRPACHIHTMVQRLVQEGVKYGYIQKFKGRYTAHRLVVDMPEIAVKHPGLPGPNDEKNSNVPILKRDEPKTTATKNKRSKSKSNNTKRVRGTVGRGIKLKNRNQRVTKVNANATTDTTTYASTEVTEFEPETNKIHESPNEQFEDSFEEPHIKRSKNTAKQKRKFQNQSQQTIKVDKAGTYINASSQAPDIPGTSEQIKEFNEMPQEMDVTKKRKQRKNKEPYTGRVAIGEDKIPDLMYN